MSEKINQSQSKATKEQPMPLTKKNYVMMLVGALIIILGFVLMSGGGEHTVTEFDESIFSFRRITLAPILIVGGFAFEVYALLKKF